MTEVTYTNVSVKQQAELPTKSNNPCEFPYTPIRKQALKRRLKAKELTSQTQAPRKLEL